VWSPRVVFDPPPFNHDLRLLERVKDFSVQALIPQLPVEALAVAVLPRTARLDVQRSGPHIPQPLPQFLRDEFWTLSERMFSGIPRHNITSANASIIP
jgi:hypothetical protein